MAQQARGGVVLPFILVTLIWSSTWIVIRDQLSAVPPSWSVCYRFLVAGAAMALFATVRRVPLRLPPEGIAFAAMLGLAQFVLNFNFVYRAEHYLTSGVVATVYAMLLIPNSILAWIAFRQPVSRAFMVGSAIAIAGIVLLLVKEYRAAEIAPGAVVLGVALSIAGLFSASAANVMQGMRVARRLPMVAVLAWAMLIGGAMDAAYAWITAGPPVMEWRAAYVLGIAWLAIAGSVVSFPLYFQLIQRIGAARAAYSGVLIPVIAMLISTAAEGYRWTALSIAGAVLAVVGMTIALRAKEG
ncbi:drug/metabolite transporter (DMT)-like permease [Sphingobium wenxiniae]|uniref:EamA-like transporter family protein n=1 Tax=Sphingobium wenxiniae (strain DSM 21828 / CGMCC 1.7748 / JZ-1) TaxID=595605 RepID=A0A562KAQ8_SPHWJ|nr:EamA family transporter [Sphingobium wenxiniae]MBB6192084.1 drug/metabolite transporter (DMT)-like permease [Sphingobium wenxiniae]TWH92462.1 EamA-like transporter family protein [Sphingobium wenxiniae]